MGRAEPDPVTAHARAVAAGEVVVNRLHQRACERHLDDLVSGSARGLRFDPAAARHAIDFFTFLRHSSGRSMRRTEGNHGLQM